MADPTPPATSAGSAAPPGRDPRAARTAIFRWKGIIPVALLLAVVVLGWKFYGATLITRAITSAGSKAIGSEVDIDHLAIHFLPPSVDIRGFAIADADDLMRNRLVIGRAQLEVEVLPLFQKKVVVRNLAVADVRTGVPRTVRARVIPPDTTPGVLDDARQFVNHANIPAMALAPIDSIKALVLHPEDLKAVQAAQALAQQADSAKAAAERNYAALRIQPVIDSASALATRLQGMDVRKLGLGGARTAITDVRRAVAQVDSAKKRVEQMAAQVKASGDSLQAQLRAVDDARKADYATARSLLKLPSFSAADLGPALLGTATMQRFQQAVHYAALARQYAPPGLKPRPTPGPKRQRMSGTTVHFVTPTSYPRFLLRNAEGNLVAADSIGFDYAFSAKDVTTDPAIIGRPTSFMARRVGGGAARDSVRLGGSLDHTRAVPRDSLTVVMSGLPLPGITLPMLPYVVEPGKGAAQLRVVLDGDRLSGTWTVHTANATWRTDSARARPLNQVETLVAQALTGINTLDITAEVGGTIRNPTFSVRSNLDRVVADRVRSVAGAQIAAAEARVRAQVDKLVDEKTAPLKQKVADTRAQAEQKVAEARTRLDAEKKKLEDRLKALTGGIGIPGLRPDA